VTLQAQPLSSAPGALTIRTGRAAAGALATQYPGLPGREKRLAGQGLFITVRSSLCIDQAKLREVEFFSIANEGRGR